MTVHCSQSDKNQRTLVFRLYDGATPFTIPSGTTAIIQGRKKDGNVFEYNMTVSTQNGTVSVTLQDQMTIVSGDVLCEVILTNNGNTLGTANFVLAVEPSPLDEGALSESNIPSIRTLVQGGQPGQFLQWGDNGAQWADVDLETITDAQIDALFS